VSCGSDPLNDSDGFAPRHTPSWPATVVVVPGKVMLVAPPPHSRAGEYARDRSIVVEPSGTGAMADRFSVLRSAIPAGVTRMSPAASDCPKTDRLPFTPSTPVSLS